MNMSLYNRWQRLSVWLVFLFSTFIYNIEGKQTAKLVASDSNRIPVTMDQIPSNLAHAFVAIEDERFYDHNGIIIFSL